MSPAVAAHAAATDTAARTRRGWPVTGKLLVVLVVIVVFVVFLLFPFQLLVAGGEVSRLFGDIPSRDRYISAAMRCLTTLPAFAAMIWCGWQGGSRRALWLIGGPAALMALSGFNLLATGSYSSDPHPDRVPGLADVFGGSTWINWVAFVPFVGWALATHLRRRRARATEISSAA